MEKTNALSTFTVYDAAVATEDEVVPSINAVLLVLGADESVDVFVAVPATVPDDIFFTWDGIKVAFSEGFIASSKKNKTIDKRAQTSNPVMQLKNNVDLCVKCQGRMIFLATQTLMMKGLYIVIATENVFDC